MLRVKEYIRPNSVEEAYELLLENRNNRIIGGMLWLKMQDITIPKAIDLANCSLDQIEETEDEITLGAMVTLRQLEVHETLNLIYDGIVSQSVKSIVGVQFRNLATIGGSIFSRFGFSDLLTSLLVLPVDIVLHHRGRVSLSEFVNMPYEKDILTHVVIKKENGKACYFSERRSATDFPILCVSGYQYKNELRIAVGARPKKAQLVCVSVHESIDRIIEKVLSEMEFEDNMRASAQYRKQLAGVLTKRCLERIKGDVSCL